MPSLTTIENELNTFHLLKHPFYQLWSVGELPLDVLKIYAQEYYHHVAAFPRYVSGVHTLCDDLTSRQVLLGNLNEEENEKEPHPELWANFARELGCSEGALTAQPKLDETKELVEGYFQLTRHSYEKGLGAVYAYERQTPEVSVSKMNGLKEFYGIESEKALRFFTVHVQADEWHAQECAALFKKLPSSQAKTLFREGAVEGAKLLWRFLDGMFHTFVPSQCQYSACASIH